jgi:hypothetical protein
MGREKAKELLWHYLKSLKEGCRDDADNHCEIERVVDEICDAVRAELEPRLLKIERGLSHAANTASCLANGILPD